MVRQPLHLPRFQTYWPCLSFGAYQGSQDQKGRGVALGQSTSSMSTAHAKLYHAYCFIHSQQWLKEAFLPSIRCDIRPLTFHLCRYSRHSVSHPCRHGSLSRSWKAGFLSAMIVDFLATVVHHCTLLLYNADSETLLVVSVPCLSNAQL